MQKSMICSACKSNRIITDHESVEVVCTSCGLVISDNVEEAQAIRHLISTKTNEVYDKTINTSSPISLARYDMGLSTIMGKPTKDASGNVLDAATRSRMARLKTWDLRITPHNSGSNRSLREACAYLRVVKDKLGLPDAAVEKAAYIYRKAKNKGLVRGRTISGVSDAAAYIACRELGIPKTLKEIAEATNIKPKALAQSYRLLISELDIKLPAFDHMKNIVKVANKANLNEKTKRKAMDIMYYINEKELPAGKIPTGIAATALYIACLKTGEKISQTDIAHAAGITEVTLRNRYKDMKDLLSQI
jgi:transcription initiation factor TFIIB